jgi:hypothetical protein
MRECPGGLKTCRGKTAQSWLRDIKPYVCSHYGRPGE